MGDRQLLWPLLVLLAAACGSPEAERAAEPRAEAPRRESAFDPLTSTIDRAEGVQQTLDAQAAEQRRRLEEAER
jgi:hypothetical protein